MMPSPRGQKKAEIIPRDLLTPPNQNNRPLLKYEDVCVGCIVWLPEYIAGGQALKCKKTNDVLQEPAYDHPAVILNVRQRGGSRAKGDLIISVAMVTTFKDTTLSHYLEFPSSRKHRNSIPITGPDRHDVSPALHLEGQKSLRKQSYVRLRNAYEIPISMLRAYDFGRHAPATEKRLDKASYIALMAALELPEEPYAPSNNVLIQTLGSTESTPPPSPPQDPGTSNPLWNIQPHSSWPVSSDGRYFIAGTPLLSPLYEGSGFTSMHETQYIRDQQRVPNMPQSVPQPWYNRSTRADIPVLPRYENHNGTSGLPSPTPDTSHEEWGQWTWSGIRDGFLFVTGCVFFVWVTVSAYFYVKSV